MQPNTQSIVRIAADAAYQAGTFVRREFGRVHRSDHQRKNPNDFFTYVDIESENIILSIIQKYFPTHAIQAEESGFIPGSEYVWYVDPLDGTNNYLHKIPFYSISIGISYLDRLIGGVVFAPELDEMFTGIDGEGAYLNDRRIRVNPNALQLAEAMVAFSFPNKGLQQNIELFNRAAPIIHRAGGVRRLGSAALDLAWVACGRLDGLVEFGLQKHDIAGGAVLVREAGGIIGAPDSREGDFFETGNLVAGPVDVHRDICDILDQHRSR